MECGSNHSDWEMSDGGREVQEKSIHMNQKGKVLIQGENIQMCLHSSTKTVNFGLLVVIIVSLQFLLSFTTNQTLNLFCLNPVCLVQRKRTLSLPLGIF
jgi:hypothetical protein